ncbi:hypothetical protein ACFL00_02045 [Pseudomonadota bacterium]
MRNFILALGIIFLVNCSEPSEPVSPISESADTSTDGLKSLSYEIVGTENISVTNNQRMKCRVVVNVDEIPSLEALRDTAIEIRNKEIKNWRGFTILFYLPDMNTSSAAYGIADFDGDELSSLNIQDFALYDSKWRSLEQEQKQADELWAVQKKTPEVVEYRIEIGVTKSEEGKLDIVIDTNFPDETSLRVSIYRIFYRVGESEEYWGEIFDQSPSVKDGKIVVQMLVDDAPWHQQVKKIVRQFEGAIPDISRITKDLRISVLYSARHSQPQHIKETLGQSGEFVGGVYSEREEGYTMYRVSKIIEVPVTL